MWIKSKDPLHGIFCHHQKAKRGEGWNEMLNVTLYSDI